MDEFNFNWSKIKLPTVAFAVYILLIPFEAIMATKIVVFVSYATIAATITSLLVLVYLLAKPKLVKITKTAFPWIAFFLWSALSIFWSINRSQSIYDFIFITKHLFFLLIISSYPFNYSEKRMIRHAIIFSGILISMSVFFTTFQVSGITRLVRATVANGYYKADPNHIAATLMIPISFLIVDFVEKKKFSILDLVAAVILFSTIIYTGSRGAYAAFLAMVAYFVFLYAKSRHRKKIILSLVFVLAVISLAISLINPDLFSRFANISELDRYSSHRTEIWKEAAQLSIEKPFAGYGFGTFKILSESMNNNFKTAHNIFIQSLTEGGVISLLLMVIAVIPLIRLKTQSAFDRAAKTGVIGVLISSLFLYSFNYDYFWLSIILAEIANRSHGYPKTFAPDPQLIEPTKPTPRLVDIVDIN